MYSINLYKDGVFRSQVGGEIRLLTEALKQFKALVKGLNATEAEEIVALKFTDKDGAVCALVLVDDFNQPIRNVKYTKED